MSECQDRRSAPALVTLSVGGSMTVGALVLELVAVRDGQAALRAGGGLVLLGWPGDEMTLAGVTLKIKRVQPSRATVCVEGPERVRRV